MQLEIKIFSKYFNSIEWIYVFKDSFPFLFLLYIDTFWPRTVVQTLLLMKILIHFPLRRKVCRILWCNRPEILFKIKLNEWKLESMRYFTYQLKMDWLNWKLLASIWEIHTWIRCLLDQTVRRESDWQKYDKNSLLKSKMYSQWLKMSSPSFWERWILPLHSIAILQKNWLLSPI